MHPSPCTRLHSNVESPHLPYTWTRAHAHHFIADTMNLVLDAENWMQSMYAILKEKRLIDVRMPGTHHSDSNPFKGHIPIASYISRKLSKCQGCSIEFQLKNGIRHLDMRPGQYKSEIRSVHGPSWLARGSDTEGHLDQIVDFITTHPMEFVVLTMESTSAAQLTPPLKEKLCQMLLAKFKHYMVTLQDELCLATVTMGQLWELDKRIVVIVESALLPDIPDAKNVYDKQGLYNWSWEFSKGISKDGKAEVKQMRAKAKSVTGYVPNVLDLATAMMTTQIQDEQISNRTFFAASLYNDPFGPGWFFGKLTAPFPWGPETFAKRCGKRRDLHVWYNRLLDEHAPSFRVNIIDIDFCENDLRFVNVIINSNSRFVPRMGALGDGTTGTASGLMAHTNTTTTNGNATSTNGNTTMANGNTILTNVNTTTSNGNTTTTDASTLHDGNTVSFAGHSSGMGVEPMASGISLTTDSNRERSESVGTSYDM